MSKRIRFVFVAVLGLLTAESAYGHGPRYYYGYGPSVYVQPRVIVAPPPPVVVAPAPVPMYAYPAPVYAPAPVYVPPPMPAVTYGATVGPRGHLGIGYSSPGFGFYYGR